MVTPAAMNARLPPPLVVLALGAMMWGVNQALPVGQFQLELRQPVAIMLLLVGLSLALAAVVAFVQSGTTINPMRPARATTLITHGVFRVSRNPIYLGDLLILAAWAVWLGNLINLIFLVAFVWIINRYQIAVEERALAELFGQRYLDYCAAVRRWL